MKTSRTNSHTALLSISALILLTFFGDSVSARDDIAKTNRPPVSYAGKERVAVVGEAVDFHGEGASLGQSIVEYSWDFESDGLIDFVSSKTASTTHTFTAPGDYRSLLKVKDSSGQIAQCVRRILVIPLNADRKAAENALHPVIKGTMNVADGFVYRYAIMFNGAGEDRFWRDVTLCYAMLTNHYGFSPTDIHLLNYDGTSPNGDNAGGMIDCPASLEWLQTVVSNLTTIVDSDDEVFFWITDHGRGYSGPLSQGGYVLGYLDGRASVDPGDEPDFPESDFKLRSLMTGGDFISNHGLNVWKVFRSSQGEGKTAFYRNKYVSYFDNVYVETLGAAVTDNDVFIERFVDYARGDTNRDGFVDTSIGEVFDYDGDGNAPHDPATGMFDEDDWGEIDVLEDNFNHLNTLTPEGATPYQLFDSNFEGKLCVDFAYDGIQLHVDGRDEDGMGLFDWMDVTQDGDTNDTVSVDEGVMSYSGAVYDDDLRAMLSQLSAAKITIVAEPCYSGGLVEDLSATNRVICTASIEDAVSWGNLFIRGFIAALHGQDEYGSLVDADANQNGAISMLEAFNYAAGNDFYDEIPQYDDNGDGISHAAPVLIGPEGLLGSTTYLSGSTVTSNLVNEWTKPISGSWEEPYWSLGQLPKMDQALVAFRNPGWKALAIGANTTANHSNSLAVNYLTVDAPPDSSNRLLLNWAGLDVPLFVNSDFIVGPNGSLASYYSALRGGNFYLSGPATFSESSTVSFSKIEIVGTEMDLTNSSLTADLLNLEFTGAVTQSGGSNRVSSLQLSDGSAYNLNSGTLVANSLDLQSLDGAGVAQFTMLSGHMDVQGLMRLGYAAAYVAKGSGEFSMEGGRLHSAELKLVNGSFTQTGGTNVTLKINLPEASYGNADYFLSSGTLTSSNVLLGNGSPFTSGGYGNLTQSGGVHSNSTMKLYGYARTQTAYHSGRYFLNDGLLVSGLLDAYCGTFIQNGGKSLIQELHAGVGTDFKLHSGELVTSNTTVALGFIGGACFSQTGGTFTVQNQLLVESWAKYDLTGGILNAANIQIESAGEFRFSNCVISNSSFFTIQGGGKVAIGPGTNGQLGALRITNGLSSSPATFDVNPSGFDFTVVQFQDSHEIPWSGTLRIQGWHPPHDRILVGANSQGLTSAQLNQITFVNPFGWPPGNYAATHQPNGELVPLGAGQAEGYTYRTVNGAITITGYTSFDPAVVIPGTIADLPVAAIGEYAFYGCTSLMTVTIPKSVTSIGFYAFAYCTNLAGVYFRGDAPVVASSVFAFAGPTVYFLPGTTGWETTLSERPTAPWFLPNPVILDFGPSFGLQTNRFGFVISWATNISVVVEACTNLANPAWSPLQTNALTEGSSYFSDPLWTNFPSRFYRVRSL